MVPKGIQIKGKSMRSRRDRNRTAGTLRKRAGRKRRDKSEELTSFESDDDGGRLGSATAAPHSALRSPAERYCSAPSCTFSTTIMST